jgi:hypothetical protein
MTSREIVENARLASSSFHAVPFCWAGATVVLMSFQSPGTVTSGIAHGVAAAA